MWGRLSSSLFICAGDISGDQHASRLITRLKDLNPDLKVWGVGGPALEKQGAQLLFNSQDLTVVGIMNVLKMLPMLANVRAKLIQEIGKQKPDAVLLVDYGGFNLNLAQLIRRKYGDLPIIYFISPQVWGSRPWRIRAIARTVSKMLVIFPFEQTLYRSHGIDADFVGHPLTESFCDAQSVLSKEEFCQKYNLNANLPLVGLFPGSRKQEIKAFMPALLQAISQLHNERPEVQFAISQANPQIAEHIYDALQKAGKTSYAGSLIKFINADDNRPFMAAADILWTKSGTTTLEAAFLERPMLIYYGGDYLSYLLFVLFKTVKFVGWPNILAGRMLVPELIQLDCRADQFVRYTRDLLDVPGARAQITALLKKIKSYLRKGDFASNAAEHVQTVLAKSSERKLKVAE